MSTSQASPAGYGYAFGTRRLLNDSIAKSAERLDGSDGSSFGFLCECGDVGCKHLVHLTIEQYRDRSGPLLAHAPRATLGG